MDKYETKACMVGQVWDKGIYDWTSMRQRCVWLDKYEIKACMVGQVWQTLDFTIMLCGKQSFGRLAILSSKVTSY